MEPSKSYRSGDILRAGVEISEHWVSIFGKLIYLPSLLLMKMFRYKSQRSENTRPSSPPRNVKHLHINRQFDLSKYSTRLIALKFAYLGQRYNGLEYHPNSEKPLPTIEEELWKALTKSCLISPTPNSFIKDGDVNWEGCDYSKCGRTDKGVSAFGQVISIRVRSNRHPAQLHEVKPTSELEFSGVGGIDSSSNKESTFSNPESVHDISSISSGIESNTADSFTFHPVHDEIPYTHVLNRLLPPDIRVLAWCPNPPPDFSARFSCKERRYRYFFTQPAFTPTFGTAGFKTQTTGHASSKSQREGWLDIEAMKKAAKYFEGFHDFRNFCKVDAGKQVTNFERRMFYADIEETPSDSSLAGYMDSSGFQEYDFYFPKHEPSHKPCPKHTKTPKIYAFTIHGSGFLWHQVRCMVAILFLVGQGLESPDIVAKLLDVQTLPQKPTYEMAEDAPLVLWDCIFPNAESSPREDALEWVYVGDQRERKSQDTGMTGKNGDGRHGHGGTVDKIWELWHQRKLQEILAGSLLDMVVQQRSNDSRRKEKAEEEQGMTGFISKRSQKVYLGGNSPRLVGNYIPVLAKPRMDSIEEINSRYAARKALNQTQ